MVGSQGPGSVPSLLGHRQPVAKDGRGRGGEREGEERGERGEEREGRGERGERGGERGEGRGGRDHVMIITQPSSEIMSSTAHSPSYPALFAPPPAYPQCPTNICETPPCPLLPVKPHPYTTRSHPLHTCEDLGEMVTLGWRGTGDVTPSIEEEEL